MGTNEKEIRYIFNNQGNNSLVYDNYIIPYCRPNKDGSINYKCRHHKIIDDDKVPCPASITILKNKIVRGVFDHNHEKLSDIVIKSKIAQYEEKLLAQTTRQPLSQIHTKVQSKLVQELTEGQLKKRLSEF